MRKLLALSAALVAAGAWAIEPPKPAPSAPATTSESKPTAETAAPAETRPPAAPEPDEELPPLPPEAAAAGPPPTRFTPTEKVRADFPVSFPIDI